MNEQDANYFLEIIRQSKRGKLKIYIGMSAGVGKTYRMLQEAHALLRNGVDVKIGYVETHNRAETVEILRGLPVIERRQLFYKGKQLSGSYVWAASFTFKGNKREERGSVTIIR